MALPVHMTSLPRLVARSLAALCRRGSGDRTDQTQARAILEELEPRILYSADSPVALFGDAMVMVAADPRAPSAAAPSAPGAQPASTQVQEIVFIDTRVPDYQVLVDDLLSKNDASRQFEIFVLDPNLDGVEQIGQVLAQRHNISALHIISHGSDGNVALGNGALNFDTLLKQANQIKSWGDALTEDGDMLIYGCDVAATLDGQALLKALSRLTGADVAASDDLTGNKLLGGDWDLEFNAGTIETSIAVSQSSQQSWAHTLGVVANEQPWTNLAANTDATKTISATHTVTATPGTDRLLLVTMITRFGNDQTINITSATFGGVSLHSIVTGSDPSTRTGVWTGYLLDSEIPTGAKTLSVTFTSTVDNPTGKKLLAATYSGVDQTTPISDSGANNTKADAPIQFGSQIDYKAGAEVVYVASFGGTSDQNTTEPAGYSKIYTNELSGMLMTTISHKDNTTVAGNSPATTAVNFLGTDANHSLAVVALNPVLSVAPTVTLPGGPVNYTENDPATIIDATATASDTDSANFDTGTLTVDYTANGTANDRLAIRNQGTGAGQIGVSGAIVTYANVTIGTWTGGTGTTPLAVTFNASSTPVAAQALMRNITYANVSDNPATATRTVRFVLSDGDGGISTAATKAINVAAVVDHILTVDTTSDTLDGTTTSIDALLADKGADGFISLREAITAANNTAGADTINFNIAGAGVHTINLASALPTIGPTAGHALIIDGTSEPDYAGTPVVRIDGAAAGFSGISIGAGGGSSTIKGLMITGFTVDGINVASGANNVTIADNWIGTAGTGTTGHGNSGVGNTDDGIDIAGSNASILRNVITNSNDEGITIVGSGVTGHVIQNNIIGLDPDGATGVGNNDVGLAIISGSGNTIGGTTLAARNVISKNWEGMEINTSNNIVQGNYIGTDAGGTLNRGNRLGSGVQIQGSSTGNMIGGEANGAGNLIAFNAQNGVEVVNSTTNAIVRNSIHSNTLLGINLGTAGVTANDAPGTWTGTNRDPDGGANNLQNFPVLTSAVTTGTQVMIMGTLDSTGSTSYRIEFYSNTTGDGTGYGEGQTLLGVADVTTNAAGNASFSPTFSAAVSAGSAISATVSKLDLGDAPIETSEFALNVTATAPPNTAPVTGDDFYNVNEDSVLSVAASGVLANDTDPEFNTLTARLISGPSNGTLLLNPTGSTNSTNLTGNAASDSQVSWSPDGSKLVFRSDRDGNGEIYIMDANGANPINLTNDAGNDAQPEWSPDGSKIAFRSGRDGNNEIYVMNADGSNQTRLTNDAGDDGGPTWSADGTKIAFFSNRDGDGEIWVMDANGSNPTQLTINTDIDGAPSWSPDGSKVVFRSNRDGNVEIYVMAANGSNQVRLTNNAASDVLPRWSPDGSHITFVSDRDGNNEIYVMDADGSNPTRITNNAASDSAPEWSPDGSKIAFDSDRDGNSEIYAVDLLSDGAFTYTPNANFNGVDSFAYVANDGNLESGAATVTITVNPVADTPSVTNATTNEDTQTASGLVISRNAADGAEVTHFKVTGITNGTLYKSDGVTQITTGTFITFAEGNAGLKFTPSANFNGSGSFTVQASTSNLDARLGGSAVNATITVNAGNDAPSLDISKSPTLAAQNEDSSAPVGAVGTLVSSLVDFASPAGQVDNVTDVDASPLLGIAVTAAHTTNGTWWYSINSGSPSWIGLGAVSDSNARLLAADNDTRLYFQPNANYNGTLANAITFRAWDGTTGADGGTANLASTYTVRDQFDSVSYSNNNGSVNWIGTWQEVGEGDGTAGGMIRINAFAGLSTNSLHVETDFLSRGVSRQVDLSTASSATLSFDYIREHGGGTNGVVSVDVYNGATWTTIHTFSINASDATAQSYSADISAYANANTQIRFIVTGNDTTGRLHVDNLQVNYTSVSGTGGTTAFSTATDTASLVVNPVADIPSVTNATTNEDTQTTSGLIISRNAADGTEVTHFKITGIANGSLFQADGTTAIINGDFINFAQGNAGLKFTPTTSFTGAASFDIQASLSSSDLGLGGSVITATISVGSAADTPSVTNATTVEDVQTTSGLAISRNVADGPEVTHFKITGIASGALYQNDGTTAISNGQFITFAEGNAGLKFTPTNDFFGSGTFDIQASTAASDGGLGGSVITATITVSAVGDTPQVASSTTDEDTQSGLIVIARNANDGPEVTHFRISGIANGSLFQADGTTAIANGDFITFAQAQAGLRFTPSSNSTVAGTFDVESSEDGATVAAQSGVATSTITVTPVGDTPQVASITTIEDTQSGLIVIDRNTGDGAEVTHFRVSSIANGTLYQADGTTAISNGDFITYAQAQAGLRFTPAANSTAAGTFDVESSEDGATVAAQSGVATSTITVTPVGDTPQVANITTNEDTQSGLIVVDRNANDGAEVTHFRVSSIANGTLYQADGSTAISNGDYITYAQAQAGLRFTPSSNSTVAGSFDVESSEDGTTVAAQSAKATSTITVTPVGDTPQVANITTNEDTQSGLIVVDRNAGDGAEVTHFRVSGIANGALFQADGTTAISNGDYITYAQAQAGLRFTPAADSTVAGSFDVESSEDGATVAAQSAKATSTITVTPVGDTPQVTSITTIEDTQSGLIVIDRHANDGAEVTHFRISGIANGTLYQADGTTAISNGDYITYAQAQAGLRFTPSSNSTAAGTFDVESSEDGATVAAQSAKATSTITVTPVGDTPQVASITTIEDTQSGLIVIDRHANDGAEVTHFRVSGIANGALFQADGTTAISNGDYITYAQAQAGLRFTPSSNSTVAGSFDVESSEDGATVAAQSAKATSTITVTPVGDTPQVASITTIEDTQSGLIVIDRHASDGAEVTHFRVSGIANGSLFQADGVTAIANGDFITYAQGQAGLKFTPAANSTVAGTFDVESSQDGTSVAAQSGVSTSTITVTPVGDTPQVANITTNEDTQSGLIVVDRNANDGAEVTHFRVSGIANGTLFQADGTTAIGNGDYITYAQAQAGLRFTPSFNSTVAETFDVESSEDGATVAAQSAKATSTITVTPVGDTPQVASITTIEDTQSGLIVIARNANDGAEVTHFKITGISNGTLYKNDGTTQITNGSFITFAEGNAGLKFTPTPNFNGSGSFTIQASTSNVDAGLGGSTVNASITVDAVNDAPVRTAGSPAAISVGEDSANMTAVTLGMGSLTYSAGGGADEAAQTLTSRVTVIPAHMTLWLADGTTQVTANTVVTLAQLQGLKYKTVADANGSSNLTWTVQDDGGTANGGVDTLTETLSVTVNAVNDAPVRTAGAPSAISVDEDSANTTAVTLGLGSLTYAPGGGADEAGQTLTYKVTVIPSHITLWQFDGTTPMLANDTLTLTQLQGLKYKTVADANGSANLTWTVQDNGGTASGGADTLTENLAITVNAENDAPVLTSASLTLNEGQTVTLSGANFDITDPDDTDLAYTVSGISGGFFQLSSAAGTPITSFTSADLAGNLVQFVDDGDEVAPAFSVTVNDSDVDSNTLAATINYTPVNDAAVMTSASLTLGEGQTVTLSGANFGVTDPDDTDFTYTVSSVAGGFFQLSSSAGAPITSFTSADLSGGLVQFVDDGDEVAPSFSVTVNDGDVDSNTLAATINYSPANDAPVVTSASLTLNEGQTVTLSGTNFGITDPDDTDFAYTVSSISGGYFQLSSAAGTPITSFSSADLSGNLVQFVDDGDEVAPAFSVTVNDGDVDSNTLAATINYTPVNDAAVMTSASLTLGEGQTVTLSGANFGVTDPDDTDFTYTVSSVAGGFFQLSSSAGTPITTFTSADLTGSLVQFVDDGDEVAPAFSVTVNNGDVDSNTLAATINYTPTNDAPVVTSATLTLNEGQTVTLSGANFGVTDPDDSSFTYTVSSVSGGFFQLSSAAGTPITSFTSADLTSGLVQFVDDDDEVAPSMSVTANDGKVDSNTLTATINYTSVNNTPILQTNQLLTLAEGASGAIDASLLLTTDSDDAAAELTYSVISPTSVGRLESVAAPGVGVTQFTQADVNAGQLRYAHDGSETLVDTFTFIVVDARGATFGSVAFRIAITPQNDAPTLSSTSIGPTLVLSGGAPQTIDATLGVTDPDSPLLVQAVVRISGQYMQGFDRLTLGGTHPLSAVWNAADGSLTLSGAASPAAYAAALSSVQFSSSSTLAGTRGVSFVVSDGAAQSAALGAPIELSGVNVVLEPPAAPGVEASRPVTSPAPVVAPPIPRSDAAPVQPGPNTTTDHSANTGAPNDETSSSAPADPEATQASAAGGLLPAAGRTSGEGSDSSANAQADVSALVRSMLKQRVTLDLISFDVAPAPDADELADLALLLEQRLESASATLSYAQSRNSLGLLDEAPADEQPSGRELDFDVLADPGVSGGLLISASVLWWATRAGGLLAAMMASVPAWRSFDPLPILARSRSNRGETSGPSAAAATDDLAVDQINNVEAPPTVGTAPPGTTHRTMIEELVAPT